MSEIKIVIDSYNESDSLKGTNQELEKMLTHLKEIARVKGSKAKNTANIKEITKETAELKRLEQQTDKVKIATAKLANEQQKVAIAAQKAASAQELANKKVLIAEQQLEQQKAKTALANQRLADSQKKAADAAEKAAEKEKRQGEAYAQLSAKHRELAREAKNLAATYGIESKAAQDAAAKANVLGNQLKAIDAKMGDHRRNVGNYASAWSGLNNVLGQFGIALSVGAVFTGLKSTVHAFVEAEKNAHALEFAVKNVGNEGEVAFQKLIKQSEELQKNGGIFSDDEIQSAQTQLVNYGLLSNEVEELMPKILDLATAQGVDLATATDTVIKGINGQTKGLKTVGLGFEDTGSRAQNYQIILDKLNKFQGASAQAAQTTEGKYRVLMNAFDDMQEQIGEFLVNEGYEYLQYWSVLSGEISAADLALQKLREKSKKAVEATLDPEVQKVLASVEAAKTNAEKVSILSTEIASLSKRIADTQKIISDLAAKGQDTTLFKGALDAYQAQYEMLKEVRADIENPASEDFDLRTGDGASEEAKKKAGKSARELEFEKYKARREGRYKQEELDRQAAYQEEQRLLNEIEMRRKQNEEIKEAQEELDHWRWKQQKEENKKREEEEKRHQAEMISYIEDFGKKAIAAAAERAERDLQIMRGQIADQEKAVDLQRQRAAQGLENTLAFEERQKATREREAIKQEQKIRRIKQSEAYWELLAAFAKEASASGDDKEKASDAAQKAALEIAEGIAISALFAEKGGIGEDLKEKTTLKGGDWSQTHGSGDMLTMISPKEGILTEQNIEALGGKEGFYALKYSLEKMGSNPISDDVFEKQNSSFMNVNLAREFDTTNLEKKIDQLTQVIENKPVASGGVDGLGNYLYTIEKRNSRTVIDKGRFINPRRNKFLS